MRINRLFQITTLLVLSGLSLSFAHSSTPPEEQQSNRSSRAMLDVVLLSIAKQVDVHDLDKDLGSETLENWISGLAAHASNVVWEWNDCGESVGRRPGENYPVCVEARFEASSNEVVGINVQVATEKKGVSEPHIWMIYVESTTGSIQSIRSLTELILHLKGAQAAATLADESIRIHVLGVAQDAGYPQAGCYEAHCMRGWENRDERITASAIAVVDNAGKSKLLFDATPHIADQLYRLHRAAPDGAYALNGVFLTHAHIGHYAGLMFFGHEVMGAQGVPVYAMPRMREFLSSNGPWDQLVRYGNIALQPLRDGSPIAFDSVTVTPFGVPHRDEYSETVGYRIEGPNKTAVFIPDIDKWQDWDTDIREIVGGVDYALLDATFYADGELPGRDMSGVRHPFITESMLLFDKLTQEEKSRIIFIHMNHTNPALVTNSEARKTIKENGFRVAFEGMQLEL